MKLGETRRERPTFATTFGGLDAQPQPCTVVYLHPEGRFYVAEFRYAAGTFRQAYPCRRRK